MMMKHATKLHDAIALIPEGASLMIGGFMGVGSPHRLIDGLVASGKKGFTVIANDTAKPGFGIGKLISAGAVRKVITSHIGTNPETQKKMIAGEIEVTLVPQGSLAERVRSGGAGLGGVLTRTGLGTLAAEGKQVVHLNGEDWLIEPALRADVALIHAYMADYQGNLTYTLTSTNFNPLFALAADTVIAEAREIVAVGVIPPDAVRTPGIVVDHLLERAA
jgi:acetate CoA/acetoacetate CoA-transferase alpha subunit